MAKKTYGQSMADFERNVDQKTWERKLKWFLTTQYEGNEEHIEELVQEGIDEGYDFSAFGSNKKVSALLSAKK